MESMNFPTPIIWAWRNTVSFANGTIERHDNLTRSHYLLRKNSNYLTTANRSGTNVPEPIQVRVPTSRRTIPHGNPIITLACARACRTRFFGVRVLFVSMDLSVFKCFRRTPSTLASTPAIRPNDSIALARARAALNQKSVRL